MGVYKTKTEFKRRGIRAMIETPTDLSRPTAMPIPKNKRELLAAMNKTQQKLAIALTDIDLSRAEEKTLPGHAKNTWMSLHDLMAYLIGWNELVLKWIATERAGETPELPETGFKWNQLGLLAQKFYLDYAALTFPELLQRWTDTHQQVLALVEDCSDHQLYATVWYRSYTLGRMIQLNTAAPCSNARNRINRWKAALISSQAAPQK